MLGSVDLIGLAAVIAASTGLYSAVIGQVNRRTVKATEVKVTTNAAVLAAHIDRVQGTYETFRDQGSALLLFLRSIERTGEKTGQAVADVKATQEGNGK